MTNRSIATTALGAILFTVIVSGCGSNSQSTEGQAEWEQAAKIARTHAAERRGARLRALRIQQALHARLIPAQQVSATCAREFPSDVSSLKGILPVACGEFGQDWPFKATWGYLRCERTRYSHPDALGNPDPKVVFTTPAGAEYAVNGNAHAVGYERIEPIMKSAPAVALNKELLAVEEAGLDLCS